MKKKLPHITSDFAILDVKIGRSKLVKLVDAGGTIPVLIKGTITSVWGRDDGTSQEFEVSVKKLSLKTEN